MDWKIACMFFLAYFTKEVNPSLAKPPLKFNGCLAKLELTSLVREAILPRKLTQI